MYVYTVFAVHFGQADKNAFITRGRQVFADIIRPQRQFAVTAIDQHSQLYALGASSVRDGFDGGTHGASGAVL